MKRIVKHLMYLLCVLLLLCACAEGAVGTENQPSESSVTTQESSFPVSENGSIEQSYENSSAEGSDEQFSEEASEDESSEPSEPKEQKELFDGATVQEIEINGGVFRVEQIKKHFNGDDLVLLAQKVAYSDACCRRRIGSGVMRDRSQKCLLRQNHIGSGELGIQFVAGAQCRSQWRMLAPPRQSVERSSPHHRRNC